VKSVASLFLRISTRWEGGREGKGTGKGKGKRDVMGREKGVEEEREDSGRASDVHRCVAVCCSVFQCVAVYCSVFQCVAVCCSESSRGKTRAEPLVLRGVSQCVAVCCSVLQCVAVCFSVLRCVAVNLGVGRLG